MSSVPPDFSHAPDGPPPPPEQALDTTGTPHEQPPHVQTPDAQAQERRARLIEEHFLGAPAELTREQVNDRAGSDLETSQRLWRALGFVDVPPGIATFTEADVEALRVTRRLTRDQGIDEAAAEALARALGQAMSHLAESLVELVSESLAAMPGLVELATSDPDTLVATVLEGLAPVEEPLQELMLYALRRHLVAGAQRTLAAAAAVDRSDQARNLAVGFADLVGWTTLTRDMPSADLAALVDGFESRAFDLIAGAGARVVKVIGDEVMFTAPTPVAVAEAGLALAASFGVEGDATPPVRVGIAWGPALARGGDVFGAVVNLASRCTSIARPQTVLADRAMARALADDPSYVLKRIPPHRVRGYDRLEASTLRRAAEA